VSVVVSDRTDGAGEEKVLSPPLRAVAVRLVSASDDSPCEGAIMERHVSCSVDTVGAIERPPVVGGGCSSLDILAESARSRDPSLANLWLSPEDPEWRLGRGEALSLMRPDCWYGLFCRFFASLRFDPEYRPPSPDEAAFRFAIFLINAENGRLRPGRPARSAMGSATSVCSLSGVWPGRRWKIAGRTGIAVVILV
jgi:hypothetical protein